MTTTFVRAAWAELLGDFAARLTAIAGKDGANAEAVVPYSYAGTMGLLQSEHYANEPTHQRLTEIGRGPAFCDCLVEVAPADPRPSR